MSEAIRRAEPAHAPAVRALVQDAYRVYVESLGIRPAPMDADQHDEIATKDVWVIEADGEIAGVLVARTEADHVFVDNVAVAPGAQGRGYARTLLERAERAAGERGVEEMRLLTNVRMKTNRAMYAHLGWVETEIRAEHGFQRVYLSKPVASG